MTPRTSKCTICNNRYALKTNATSAYDDKEKRFIIIPCLTQGCQHHCCYACRYNGADPWDAFNFELDTCAFCNHDQQRNKLSFNKKEKTVDLSNKKRPESNERSCRQF